MSQYVRQTPADNDFRDWFVKWVRKLKVRSAEIIKGGDQHEPMIFIFEKDDKGIGVVPLPGFHNTVDKDIAAALLKGLGARTDEFDGAIMVVEAWAAAVDANDKSYKMGSSIAQRPDRFEILMFNGVRGTMQLLADFKINKDRTLGEMNVRDPMNFEAGSVGRFIVGDDGQRDS
jgi:hypothetical protein